MTLKIALCVALAGLLAATGSVAAPKSPAQPLPIIDVHLHALQASDQGPPPMPICAPFVDWPLRDPSAPPEAYGGSYMAIACPNRLMSPMTDDELRKQTLAQLEKHNILAVTSGTADMVETWRKASPNRILSAIDFGLGNPPSIETLRKLHAEGHLAVIGEIFIEYEGIAVDDPRMEPYYALAEELDVPVAIHMGPGPPGAAYLGMSDFRMELSSPLRLEPVLLKHPKMRIYIMHAGWPMLDDTLALMYAHPQVYVDTGVIDYVLPKAEFARYLRTLVEAGMGKRVMFGSDSMVWPESIDTAIASISDAPYLTKAQKRDILYNNAARFLKLPAD